MVRNASNIWGEQMKGPGACVAEAEIKPHLCHRGCQCLARTLQLLGRDETSIEILWMKFVLLSQQGLLGRCLCNLQGSLVLLAVIGPYLYS